jgi:hypothetical protein
MIRTEKIFHALFWLSSGLGAEADDEGHFRAVASEQVPWDFQSSTLSNQFNGFRASVAATERRIINFSGYLAQTTP